MNRIRIAIVLSSLLLLAGPVCANVIISGVADGTNSGGTPKGMELYALTAVPDLSVYSLIRDTNGAGPFDVSSALPAVTLDGGDFLYVAGNAASETQLNGLGFPVGLVDGIAIVNGDDILGVSLTSDPLNPANLIDSFGLEGQGDTDFYSDSFAVRMNSSIEGLAPGLTDAANFDITSYTDADLQGSSGFGSYAPVSVPEPGAPVSMLGLLALILHRRTDRTARPRSA